LTSKTVSDSLCSLQIGVSKIQEEIYERDFLACSYGYRPGIGVLDAVRGKHPVNPVGSGIKSSKERRISV
jgi:retron-type reverse transcriptase